MSEEHTDPSSGLKNELSKKPVLSRWQEELRIACCYIPEDSTLHNHHCENLKCGKDLHKSGHKIFIKYGQKSRSNSKY
jgi:hypothetical protein